MLLLLKVTFLDDKKVEGIIDGPGFICCDLE